MFDFVDHFISVFVKVSILLSRFFGIKEISQIDIQSVLDSIQMICTFPEYVFNLEVAINLPFRQHWENQIKTFRKLSLTVVCRIFFYERKFSNI